MKTIKINTKSHTFYCIDFGGYMNNCLFYVLNSFIEQPYNNAQELRLILRQYNSNEINNFYGNELFEELKSDSLGNIRDICAFNKLYPEFKIIVHDIQESDKYNGAMIFGEGSNEINILHIFNHYVKVITIMKYC